MKVLKIIGSVLLILLCLAVILYTGSVLLTALPMGRHDPAAASTELAVNEETKMQALAAEEAAQAQAEAEAEAQAQAEKEAQEKLEQEQAEKEAQEQAEAAEASKGPKLEDYEAQARAWMDKMTLEEKVWQLMITTPDKLAGETPATRAGEHVQTFLEKKPVGGVVYFADNLVDQEQAKVLLMGTQKYSKTPLFLAVDEEGGRVSRCGANDKIDVTHFKAAKEYGALGSQVEVYNVGKTLAQELKEIGFNLNFAPVADIVTNPDNTEIGDRAYSDDPAVAATMVEGMVQGMQSGGLASCLKHFPGHGSTAEDSHEGKSVSTRTVDELRTNEWIPFQRGIDAGAAFVMVGHQTNPNLSDLPASLSKVVMTYLREELHFKGLIITDSLQMGAIMNEYGSGEAAVLALQAGADMLLMPNDLGTAYEGITKALMDGTLTQERIDESVLRILETKFMFGIMQ